MERDSRQSWREKPLGVEPGAIVYDGGLAAPG
jgi:hypothetical protein